MKIRDFELGTGRTFVIAETCSNIIGHLDRLETIVKDVAWTGADGLKVQIFSADHFPENERESKRRYEFPRDRFPELVELCHKHGLACGASVFDEDAADLVVRYGDFVKIASRETENFSLINRVSLTGIPVIHSYDWTKAKRILVISGMRNRLMMACIPEYPSGNYLMPGDVQFDPWGWSSHSADPSSLDCIMAVTRGARVIERHISFHHNDPERGWSLDLDSFKRMCSEIKWVESCR